MAVEDYRELLDEELRANVYGTGYSTKEAFLEYLKLCGRKFAWIWISFRHI